MRRLEQICAFTALLTLPLLAAPLAAQDKDQTIYTYVALWRVPRAKTAAYQSFFEKTDQPILDRLVADGSLREWGRTTTLLHSVDGMTDGVWFCATSFTGIQKVLAELAKVDSTPLNDLVEKHQDEFLESMIFRTGNSKATSGFLEESVYYVKPGKAEEWFSLWKKWMQPIYEKLLADGTIVGYGVDRESYHTTTPAYRSMWVIAEWAEAVDRATAAFEAEMGKRSKEEQKSIQLQMQEVLEPGTHRDNLDRVIHYGHK
jgi:hypothetical protein